MEKSNSSIGKARSILAASSGREDRLAPRVLQVATVLAGMVCIVVGLLVLWLESEYKPTLITALERPPLTFVDRNGKPLAARMSRDKRQLKSRLTKSSEHVQQLLLVGEDLNFYEHGGLDFFALGRAMYLMKRTGKRYGGSTLSMQLARMTHSEGRPRTILNKLREIYIAFQIEKTFSKTKILEFYLNKAYFGCGAYGIEEAAQKYFRKSAAALSLSEASALMVLPRGPATYNPHKHPERFEKRRKHLLDLLIKHKRADAEEVQIAKQYAPRFQPQELDYIAPHFVRWVENSLSKNQEKAGGQVKTTLDIDLQERAATAVQRVRTELVPRGVTDAGLVILDAETAEVRAMVGSYDERTNWINMTTRRRYPGSALKPFVYATAIEQLGHGSESVAFDIFDVSRHYRAEKNQEFGPRSYREALASSMNYAAVHVAEKVGIKTLIKPLLDAGVSNLPSAPSSYGPRIALGATKVRLVDLAAGYRAFVKNGTVIRPRGWSSVQGAYQSATFNPPKERKVFSKETAFIVSDILSDRDARAPMFGYDLPIDIHSPIVAKTGSAEGMSNLWAILASREFIVGAWVGRIDGKPTDQLFGMGSAGVLAREGMLAAAQGLPLTLPAEPPNIFHGRVCLHSGHKPTQYCKQTKVSLYANESDYKRQPHCKWHQPNANLPAIVQRYRRRNHSPTRY